MSESHHPAVVLASMDIGVGWLLYVYLGAVGYPLPAAGLLVLLVVAIRRSGTGPSASSAGWSGPTRAK